MNAYTIVEVYKRTTYKYRERERDYERGLGREVETGSVGWTKMELELGTPDLTSAINLCTYCVCIEGGSRRVVELVIVLGVCVNN